MFISSSPVTPMFENIDKYINDPSNIYRAFAIEFGKFAYEMAYEKLTSPGAKVVDAFVLGYYLPWLIFAKGLNDSVFSEDNDHSALSDKFTLEFYVFEAATKLQLGLDRDYVYNIKSNALIEKYSIYQKISSVGKEENSLAFNLGISLSESIITFYDSEDRNRCITEAGIWVRKLGLGGDAERTVRSLQGIGERFRFESVVEEFALAFIANHEQ